MAYQPTEKIGEWTLINSTSVDSALSVRFVRHSDFEWDIHGQISNYIVAACDFGGPIALAERGTNEIIMYTSMGKYIGDVGFGESAEKIKYMTWNTNSDQDDLIVLLWDGSVHFLNVKGDSIATSVRIENPSLCTSTGNGIAVVTEASKVVVLERQYTGEYRHRLVDLPPTMAFPSSMFAIQASVASSGYTEVYVAPAVGDITESATIFRAKFHTQRPLCEDLRLDLPGGSILRMALSPSKGKVAMLNEEGSIFVSTTELEDIANVTSTDTEEPPAQFMWCGESCVAYTFLARQFDADIGYESTVNVFDPNTPEEAETLNTATDDVWLVPDCDGIRLLSEDVYQFLQAVPACAQRIFLKGSKAPASLLVQAYDKYMMENAGSVELIRDLTHKGTNPEHHDDFHDEEDEEGLAGAINDCIAAAGFEFDTDQQKRLLRIANFGKSFCEHYDSTHFMNTTRRLRALSSIRSPEVGMMLSMAQFNTIEGEKLAKRLVQQNHYQLAFEICSYLDLKPNLIMIEWAMQKIANSSDSEQTIAKAIIEKFRICQNISYERVAMAAHAKGKDELAILLLGAEPSPKNQVPTLLDIHKEDIALSKAVESGDMSLVFMVVIRLLSQRGGKAAVDRLVKDPIAKDMLLVYCMTCESQRSLIKHYSLHDSSYTTYLSLLEHLADHDKLKVMIRSSRRWEGWETYHNVKITTMNSAQMSARGDPQGGKAIEPILAKQQELLEEQGSLASECQDPAFLSASVATTVRLCWRHNRHGKGKQAEKIKKMFNMSEKMYLWSKLKGLVDGEDWEAIDKLGGTGRHDKVKSTPIGWVPFVTELIRGKQLERAVEYIARVPDIQEKLELYIECGAWRAAAEDCLRDGNESNYNALKARAKGNAAALNAIELAAKEGATRKESNLISKFFK